MMGLILKFMTPRVLIVLAITGILGFAGYMAFTAKIRTVERDKAISDLTYLRTLNNAQAASAAAKQEALETKGENDHDRAEFKKETAVAIEAGRKDGDGPVAPVLRDAVERVQSRYKARYP